MNWKPHRAGAHRAGPVPFYEDASPSPVHRHAEGATARGYEVLGAFFRTAGKRRCPLGVRDGEPYAQVILVEAYAKAELKRMDAAYEAGRRDLEAGQAPSMHHDPD